MSYLALLDLFRRHREKATGIWRLGKEPSRTVFLDHGDVVFAQSTHPSDRLTHLLVERGKLTKDQMDYAMANLKPGLSIGKNLIQMGFITQRDLLEVARAQVERVLLGCLATADLEPAFEPKELEANVVRLPFDAPSLLLNGVLALKDRERLLELLGPLNQVVLLEGRRIHEASLPVDLARLPSLLDGTRTMLELARETNVEPLRLGAFVLFLREMGWARLHELPPLDRPSLDLALAQEAQPLSLPLPEPTDLAPPNLIATIQDAERPTTNLEHLSESLDRLPHPDSDDEAIPPPVFPEEHPVAFEPEPLPPLEIHTGHIEVPTPRAELPEPPRFQEEPEPEAEPPLPIAPPTRLQEEPPPELETPAPSRFAWPLVLGLVALVGLGLAAGYGWKRWKRPRPSPPPPKVQVTLPEAPPPAPQQAAEPPVAPEKPVAVEPKPLAFGKDDRMAALRGGDLPTAVAQGARHVETLAPSDWTLRLEIACQGETIQKAARMMEDLNPDLFLRPMRMRDGKSCYQVFMGRFTSKAAAEKVIPTLPAPFRIEGNKPRAFQVREIPG